MRRSATEPQINTFGCGSVGHHVCACPQAHHDNLGYASSKEVEACSIGLQFWSVRSEGTIVIETSIAVYTLTCVEAESSSIMVEGTVSILGHSAQVLMDSGASHSFIVKSFASILSQIL